MQEVCLIIFILIIIYIVYTSNKNTNHQELFDPSSNESLSNNLDINGYIYINLENREDRKKIILNELSKIHVPENKIHKISGVFIPKNGHKGNVQSFILALELAKLNKLKTVMICEDDMEIIVSPDEFNNKVNYLLNTLKEKKMRWDCIMLGQAYGSKTPTDMKDVVKITGATTKTCIIVPDHFYDQLLNNFRSSNDLMLSDRKSGETFEKYASDQRWQVLQDVYTFLAFDQDLVKQRNIWSSTMKYSY
jgi:hypothetical protein